MGVNPGEAMAAKILVIDDDPNVQRLLTYTLKQEGYEVLVASDGAEGFRLWGAETPALILLDIMLPKVDGYQVATKIRAEEGTGAHVPIIMLTAEREVEQKVKGLRAGAYDYLIKPFHPAELLARIKSLLARFAPRDLLVGRPPMGHVLAFYGAKGGVGTTTIAINAAIALHRELGRKVVLVDANQEDAVIEASVKKFETLIAGGGEIVRVDRWGKRRIAYEIQGRSHADYTVYYYNATKSGLVSELERMLRLDETILRFLTVVDNPSGLPPLHPVDQPELIDDPDLSDKED